MRKLYASFFFQTVNNIKKIYVNLKGMDDVYFTNYKFV